jgi:hypothetical protein
MLKKKRRKARFERYEPINAADRAAARREVAYVNRILKRGLLRTRCPRDGTS